MTRNRKYSGKKKYQVTLSNKGDCICILPQTTQLWLPSNSTYLDNAFVWLLLYHLPLARCPNQPKEKDYHKKETKRLHSSGWPTRANTSKINKINFLSRTKYIHQKGLNREDPRINNCWKKHVICIAERMTDIHWSCCFQIIIWNVDVPRQLIAQASLGWDWELPAAGLWIWSFQRT